MMIPYSLASGNRRTTVFSLAAIAIVAPNLASQLSEKILGIPLGDSSYGLHGASLALFGALYWGFDQYLWRLPLVARNLRIINLTGKWVGTLDRKDHTSGEVESAIPILVTIRQTYSKMRFTLHNPILGTTSGETTSESRMICLGGDHYSGFTLQEGFRFSNIFGVTVWDVQPNANQLSMSGDYVSSFPRTGKLQVTKVAKEEVLVRGKIERMSDQNGNSYLGIGIEDRIAKKYLSRLRRSIGPATVLGLTRNRFERDGKQHHMTVVSPPELLGLTEEQVAALEGEYVFFVLGGIGRALTPSSEAYYVVATSPHINFLRSNAGLGSRDLHVTLGFDPEDIHEVPKGPSTLMG